MELQMDLLLGLGLVLVFCGAERNESQLHLQEAMV